jgi:hypothetical protein
LKNGRRAITLLAILHVIPDYDHPHEIVARLLDAVPSGSYLAISFPGADSLGQKTKDAIREIDDRMYAQNVTYRSKEQMARFFEGADLVEPGIVPVEDWRPDGAGPVGRSSPMWCAVGRSADLLGSTCGRQQDRRSVMNFRLT